MSDNHIYSSPAMVSLTGPEFLEAGFSLSLPPTPNLQPNGVRPSNDSSLESLSLGGNRGSSTSTAADKKWTIGRAPWYDESGNRNTPLIIGVTGGSASGKTSVCKAIVDKLNIPWVQMLSMDRFYKGLTPEQEHIAHEGNYNFDHPDAFDLDKMVSTIQELKTGKVVDVPIYDFTTHSRLSETDRLYGVDVVIVEGILVLYDERVRNLLDLKIYVDTDSDHRLARRIDRDVRERGRTVHGVLAQYMATVKPSFEQYILPTKRYADLIIPWNDTNHIAVNLIVQHIAGRLEQRGKDHIRQHMNRVKPPTVLSDVFPANISVMERTRTLETLHTIIRDNTMDIEEWTFNLNRLVSLLISHAMNSLDYKETSVVTPTGATFVGTELAGDIVTVSVIRTGEIFETALRAILPDAAHGKVVIKQSNKHKVEFGPRLYYAKLPDNINSPNVSVMLLDGVLATGGAVNMAVQVLLDHGVPEENITFCCLVAAPEGLYKLISSFPRMRVVVSWVDDGLDKHGYCYPGIGYLGDRYFGTRNLGATKPLPSPAMIESSKAGDLETQ